VREDDPDDAPADTQTVKQADVIMLLYLRPELATPEELRKNWDYYEPRTTHSSTLSYGVHGIVAAQLGLAGKAGFYLEKSLGVDLYDERGRAADGAHLAAGGMSWSGVVCGSAGCRMEGGTLVVRPALPERWTRLSFVWKYQGRRFRVTVGPGAVEVENGAASRGPLKVRVFDREALVGAGERLRWEL
jgi:trehalose/maltose hydrolase-like predicted phosphorylase